MLNSYTAGLKWSILGSLIIGLALFFGAFALTTNAEEATTPVEEVVVASETEVVVEETPVEEEQAPAEEAAVVVDPSTSSGQEVPVVEEAPVVDSSTDSTSSSQASSEQETPATPALVVSAVEPAVVLVPELSTDKPDYQPGEVVTIFGKFFAPVKTFFVRVFGNSEVGDFFSDVTHSVVSGADGSWNLSLQLDNFYRPIYNMVVSDENGTEVATGSFTDAPNASVDVFSQCANDDGDGSGGNPGVCDWTNGNLNASNSVYQEEDATVQRLLLTGLANGSHVVTIEYDTTKGGKHAYDFLTDPDLSENWITTADVCSGLTAFPSCASATVVPSPNIPHDPLNTSGTVDTNQNIYARNANITSISAPALVSGSYAGDSTTRVNVTFTVNTATCLNGSGNGANAECPALFVWGAHVSSQADWGANGSAVNISGSPYHVRVTALDGKSTGNRDNQMSASVIPGTITIIKNTVPDSAQDFSFTTVGTGLSNFSLDDDNDGTLSNTRTFTVDEGSYTVTEAAAAGYAVSISCVDATQNTTVNNGTRQASINVAAGETVTCTFTNTLQQANLTLLKTVVSDNGGTALDTAWTLAASGPTPISGVEGNPAVTNAAVNAGVYTLSESGGPSTYTQTNLQCTGATLNGNQITLAPGNNATCTFTNDDNAPSLTLNKVVVNDNGGQAAESAWTLSATGPTSISGPGAAGSADVVSGAGFDAGTYTLAETAGPAGYTASAWSCTNGVTVDGNNQISIALGQTTVCTITNNDNSAHLTLVKSVTNDNGGNALPTAWTLSATGPTPISGAGGANSDVNAGVYALSETGGPAGYAASAWVCVGGAQNGSNVTLALGQSATCTITNDDIQPKLTVTKVVVNDNGGTKTVADFPLFVNATGVTSGVQNAFNAGNYTVSETNQIGYTAGSWGGDCASNGAITLAAGDVKACTITNDDQAGQITIVKNTVGGEDTFNFTVTGPTASSPSIVTANTTGTTGAISVSAGAYSVAETVPEGWDLTSATCTSGTPQSFSVPNGGSVTCTFTDTKRASITIVKNTVGGDGSFDFTSNFGVSNLSTTGGTANQTVNNLVPGSYSISETVPTGWDLTSATCSDSSPINAISLQAGESVTCTFTNTKRGSLTIVKNTVGGNGTFNFTMGGGLAPNPSIQTSNGTGSVTFNNVVPGSYTAAETVPGGWDLTSATCDLGESPESIDIGAGENVTCTFTNTKKPTLTLQKTVIKDNGGTAVDTDWTLSASGPTPISGVEGDAAITNAIVNAGAYTLSESGGPLGYTPTLYSCVKNGGVPVVSNSLTLAAGENAVCTITNDDQQAYITVIKVVTSDNGGTAGPNAFALSLEGTPVMSGVQVPVNPGTYTAAEDLSLVPGYTFEGFSGDCDINGNITVALGQSKTCTLTNNDNAPSLTLNKIVIGGTSPESAWDLSATGPTSISGPGAAGAADVVSGAGFDAGTYTLAETAGPGGYSASAWSCTNGVTVNGNNEITVALGQSTVCSVTNTREQGKIELVKDWVGTPSSVDLAIGSTAGGTQVDAATLVVDGSTGENTVDTGTYYVAETVTDAANYDSSLSCMNGENVVAVGQNGSVAVGANDDIVCTYTNSKKPTLKLEKTVINDNGGTATKANFQGKVDGSGVAWDAVTTVTVGSHTASEVSLPTYTASVWGG